MVSGITLRRDSLVEGNQSSRRNSLILPDYYGRSTIPVMEVEPWVPNDQVQEVKLTVKLVTQFPGVLSLQVIMISLDTNSCHKY